MHNNNRNPVILIRPSRRRTQRESVLFEIAEEQDEPQNFDNNEPAADIRRLPAKNIRPYARKEPQRNHFGEFYKERNF